MSIVLSEIGAHGGELPEQTYEKNVLRVGRDSAECDITFSGESFPMVSRRHAEFRHDDRRWYITDLGASYGTYLDGRRVAGTERLWAGQVVQFGNDGPRLKVVWFEQLTDSDAPNAEVQDIAPNVLPTVPARSTEPMPYNDLEQRAAVTPASSVEPAPHNEPESPKLVYISEPDRKPYELATHKVTIGRDPECEIAFDRSAVMVSRRHASLRSESGNFVLEDNGSFNGTYVNGQRIAAPTPLYDRDVLRFGIGGPELEFVAPGRSAPANAKFAGQRSIAAANIADVFAAAPAAPLKTMVFKLDASAARPADRTAPQLLMSLAFGDKKELTIGRDPRSDIRLDGLQISSRHARLIHASGSIVIDDVGSTNGVYVNGTRVSRQVLSPDDTVQIGLFELRIDAAGNVGIFDSRARTRVDAVDLVREVKVHQDRVRLLDGVSLSIPPNEFVGILGPSGSGKSTLIEAMNGVRPATSGSVLINNLDLYRHLHALKQAIGYVPQEDLIHRELTVYRTLYYVAKLRLSRDVSAAEIDQTINEVLDITGIADRRDIPVNKLSGGQRKRVSIAVELITKPSVIFLDEPTSGLDPGTEERIMKLFRQIAESGRTVILTTHVMENVELFDKIVVLMDGKLVFYGPPNEALGYLGVGSYKELFERLGSVENSERHSSEREAPNAYESKAEVWKRRFAESPQYRANVHEPLMQVSVQRPKGKTKQPRLGVFGSIQQFITLSRRYLEILFKDKLNLFILFAQPLAIALLTFLVMRPDKPRDFVYFVLALVSVWFGTSVSAREIVRERLVYRRERMVNLGILPYIGSKLFVLGLIVVMQCLVLFVPLKILDLLYIMPMPGEMFGLPQLWAMLLSGSVGIATGLLISAVVRSSQMATSLVPLILIPQMLFAGIVGVPTGIARPISLLIPAAWSFDTIKRFSTLDTLEAEGAEPKGRTGGLGLYKQIETENDDLISGTRKSLEEYQAAVERQIKDYQDARNAGLEPAAAKPDEMPAVPPAHRIPNDLSGYITFLHPWMNEVLNQIVLMLMFCLLVISTLIVLRLQDIR